MIGHRLYPRGFDDSYGPPRTTVSRWFGATSWLLGFDLERYAYEWTLMLRVGPFGLSIERVR